MQEKNINKDQSIKIYQSFNWSTVFVIWLFRAFCMAILLTAIYNYKENIPVTSIVMIIFVLLILKIGYDKMFIYSDKFIFGYYSLLPIWNSPKTVYLKEIKSISIDRSYTLPGILALWFGQIIPSNKIIINFSDNHEEIHEISISVKELEIAINKIEAQIQNK